MKDQGVAEDRLVLLNGVSGAFRPGVLTALMGVSGAGKTTLLDVCASRVRTGVVEGDLLVDGKPRDLSFQRKVRQHRLPFFASKL